MNKRHIVGLFITLVLMLPVSAFPRGAVLVLSFDAENNQQVAEGFKNAFSGDIEEINLEGSDERQRQVGEQLKAQSPEVAVVVGDLAAQMAKWYLSGVPVVYCASARAAKISLSQESAVGIYHEPGPQDQFETLARAFPEKKNVALIYSSDHTLKEDAIKSRARDLGFTLELAPMASIKQVPEKLRQVLPETDLLWVLTDPVVLSSHSIQYIVLQSISARVPVFCGDNGLAHGGATAALVPDLENAGKIAAEEAGRIIKGSPPQAGSLRFPKGKLVLNQKTAALMQVSFPQGLLIKAAEIIQ